MKNLPAQVWRLMLAYALMMAGTSLMVLIAGIIGTKFAPSPAYATLPVALTIVGLALSTLPTGNLQNRFGRRKVFICYGFLAMVAALLAATSLSFESFFGFCTAAVMIGWSAAAGHQYRFAAMESVTPDLAPKATSVLLFGGILAAVVVPELAVWGQHLLATECAGSYLMRAGVYGLGIIIISFYQETKLRDDHHALQGRPLLQIICTPLVILAIGASTVAYGVMSFVMTAGPISMHEHAGHSLQATKLVLQSHIAAMYLPSLAFPWLLSKLGYKGMMWIGVLALLLCLTAGAMDTQVLHYWITMVVLGIGWNFLFLSGTNLLRHGYRVEERFKVQSFNDFLVFSIQGIASLSSGWFLFKWGWQGVIMASVPLVLAFAVLAWISSGLRGVNAETSQDIAHSTLNPD